MRRWVVTAAALVAGAWGMAGGPAGGTAAAAGPERSSDEIRRAFLRPDRPIPAPRDNPLTTPSVMLGRALFFDPALSANRTLSCASCHRQDTAWADRVAKPVADNGRTMGRRTQTLVDTAWQDAYLWDGRRDTLEAMVPGPITAPAIMGLPADALPARLAERPEYAALFESAYPGEGITMKTTAKALSGFMRVMVSPRNRFDRWVEGEEAALSAREKRGFALFAGKANCAACHAGWRFTDDGFRDIGLPDTADRGRAEWVPAVESMMHAFKTPTLRSVAERPPYMHDGSLPTLEAVVEHYDEGGIRRPSLSEDMRPLGLTPAEKRDLVAFLRALSPDPKGATSR